MKDSEGNLTAHLFGIFTRTLYLIEKGILPCWVFDGQPPEAKFEVLLNRQKIKEENRKYIVISQNEEELLKYSQKSVFLNSKNIDDAKKLVELLGLPCIQVA